MRDFVADDFWHQNKNEKKNKVHNEEKRKGSRREVIFEGEQLSRRQDIQWRER